MMDLIDRNKALAETWKQPSYSEIRERLRALPTIEQPEIIRCRDCKYYNPDPADHCYLQGAEADDFCSYAERREE